MANDYWEEISPANQRHVEHGYIDVSQQHIISPWILNQLVNLGIFQRGEVKKERMLLQPNGLGTAEYQKGRLSWMKIM